MIASGKKVSCETGLRRFPSIWPQATPGMGRGADSIIDGALLFHDMEED
jgi:hypothetical protein